MGTKLSASNLSHHWRVSFEWTLRYILATRKAELAFAQVIDGLPTTSTALRIGVDDMRSDIINRIEPSTDAISIFQQYREEFDTATIQLDAQALQNHQRAPFGSVDFKLRLLGLAAVAIHHLAIETFTTLHPDGGPSHPSKAPWPGGIYIPDLFHPNYMCWFQYPRGVAELVGYWAEAEVFGGTVVSEHDADEEIILRRAFIHPPFRPLFELSTDQLDQFGSLATSPVPTARATEGHTSRYQNSEATKILPFSASPQARTKIDVIGRHPLIYRDKYERVPKIYTPGEGCVRRGVVTEEMKEFVKQLDRK